MSFDAGLFLPSYARDTEEAHSGEENNKRRRNRGAAAVFTVDAVVHILHSTAARRQFLAGGRISKSTLLDGMNARGTAA